MMTTCILVYSLFLSCQLQGSVFGWTTVRPHQSASRRSPAQAISKVLLHTASSTSTASVKANSHNTRTNTHEFDDVNIQKATAGVIASSFEPADLFDPFLSNRHVQTIGGFLLRDTVAAFVPRDDPIGAVSRIVQGIASKIFMKHQQQPQQQQQQQQQQESSRIKFWDIRERIETPDGDWFHADTLFPTTGQERRPDTTVLLLHGLESNSDSALSHQMAAAFAAQGMTVTCLNFRSCSQNRQGQLILNEKLGFYHMGFTQDVFLYLERLKMKSPNTEVFLSGFSLGANVVLKALGELGHEASTRYNIQGAAVVCAPLDQERNSIAFSKPGLNRRIYSNGIVQKLQEKARLQLEAFCNDNPNTAAFDYRGVFEAVTIMDFDKAFVAPVFGFDDHIDYYRQTSSIHFLEKITVPTFILNAKDDPFFDNDVFPIEKTVEHGGVAPIKMVHTPSGGHLGFCFHQVPSDDVRLVDKNNTSWMPVELARFFQHVMDFKVDGDRHNVSPSTKTHGTLYSRRITSNDELPAEMNVEETFERAGDNQQYIGKLEEVEASQTLSRVQ